MTIDFYLGLEMYDIVYNMTKYICNKGNPND